MSYNDQVEDQITNLKFQVINADTLDKAMNVYEKFQYLVQEQQKRYWQFTSEHFENFEEGYFHNILDRVINLNFDKINESDVEDLAIFLRIDEEFKNYCLHHVEMDGMVAALKYKSQVLNSKKDVMARALQAI